MQELPPNAFTYGNYNADIPFGVYTDSKLLIEWLRNNNIIGYCKEPEFKTIKGHVAVLFDLEEQGEYWSHIPEDIFNKYKKRIKK